MPQARPLVSVTLRLPQLVSMRAANLRVGARFITPDLTGEPTAAVALPVWWTGRRARQVDQENAHARD